MPDNQISEPKLTKGERTAARIMDVAEELFAGQGYEGTSLRQIASGAGIREPGLYNHFNSKQALYEAVLFRALDPMLTVMTERMEQRDDPTALIDLPATMTDLLLEHPRVAALFQQALQGDGNSVGNQMMEKWLFQLLNQGLATLGGEEIEDPTQRSAMAINVIALFNVTTGYFLCQRAFDALGVGDLKSPDNIARQKDLLRNVSGATRM